MKPLAKPHEEFVLAQAAAQSLSSATTLEETEAAWLEFLRRYERCWNKTEAHLKRSPKYQGWTKRGRTAKIRKSDPLLAYLSNARGADEHTVDDVSTKKSGGISINPAEGNTMHIDEMHISQGRIDIKSRQPLLIEVSPAKFELLPVVNRGRKYSVPDTHLGRALPDMEPSTLADLALDFFQEYLEKADSEFVK